MTTPSSSSLSHALNPITTVHRVQQDLPRLQLAPPEHQKQLQQVRQQQSFDASAASIQPVSRRNDPQPQNGSPISSSREVSPVIGVERPQTSSSGDKRKNNSSNNNSQQKKRRTEEENRNVPVAPYGLGTHYPFAYLYPGAPPPPIPGLVSQAVPVPPPVAPSDMSFNEFQWRLLNLCAEFYEAATELLRATPHTVLSQAFQLLGRGTGTDPITILNDARRTCDMLLANPQALSVPPPPPTGLPLPVLNSLSHMNVRAGIPSSTTPVPSYYSLPTAQAPPAPPAPEPQPASSSKGKEKEREKSTTAQGTWKEHEIAKLKALAEKYRSARPVPQEEEEEEEDAEDADGTPDEDGNASVSPTADSGEASASAQKRQKDFDDIDWDKVVAEFGDERSRHQVLIKATLLGLKPSSSIPGKKPKKKKASPASAPEPPAPTFSSASARSIPTSYTNPSSTSASNAASGSTPRVSVPPTVPPTTAPPGLPHAPYPQPGWYPQNPYYAYAQPLYYPQGYNYAPQTGYYGQPYVPPPIPASASTADSNSATGSGSGTTAPPVAEKRGPGRPRKNGNAPIPPPSLPPKNPPSGSNGTNSNTTQANKDGTTSSASKPSSSSAAARNTSTSATASPVPAPATTGTSTTLTSTPITTPMSGAGILRPGRVGGNTTLFTYTPLPHPPANMMSESGK
ncbi:hypothetical protein M422DRAFT_243244 [Sphaerobolus stellatus SS14]|nr:hypothetical protein M422DRAFT_243244 [Sphaerobolus stellatus SS14]